MKKMFPQYEEHTAEEFNNSWKYGYFVFDTNVLLNLYRYQATTRDELINVLSQLSQRIWIPHHVALEFQRNRLKVISEQNRRFSEVHRTIEKAKLSLIGDLNKLQLHKRHSLINPEPLMSGFGVLVDTFLNELELLRQSQQKLTDPDPLKEKIENLFTDRVGEVPSSQYEIDDIYKEADSRYKLNIPPGYADKIKDKDEPDEHLHGGIIYKRKYGDYLVWRQIVAFAKDNNVKQLIFITDDGKEDWWWKIDLDGPKTIGPRPELIEEAKQKGNVDTFLMYNPEGFLKYAKEFLKAKVSEQTLKEVRDVSFTRSEKMSMLANLRNRAVIAEHLLFGWLIGHFDSVEENSEGFPNIVAYRDGQQFGFVVKILVNRRLSRYRLMSLVEGSCNEMDASGFVEFTIVLVAPDVEVAEEAKRSCMRIVQQDLPTNLRILIAVIDCDSDRIEFIPYDNFCLGEVIAHRSSRGSPEPL